MFCPNCGANLPDGVKFCQVCGNALSVAPAAPEAPVAPIAPVDFDNESTVMADAPIAPVAPVAPPAAPVTPVAPMAPVAPATPQPPKKSKGLVIGIVITSIVAVAAIVVAILFGTGVIGGDKKDDDDTDKDTTESVTQSVENNDDEIYTEDIYEPTGTVRPVPTSPAVPETPTVAPANDEAEIKTAINNYFTAMYTLNGTAFKNSMSSFMDEALTQNFDSATIDAFRNDPEVAAECASYGIDMYSPDFVYSVAAIGALEDLGGVDNIMRISVNNITLGYKATPDELSELTDYFAQELGITIQNAPQVTAGIEVSVAVIIYYNDGTQSNELIDLTVLKENGQWKVVPA